MTGADDEDEGKHGDRVRPSIRCSFSVTRLAMMIGSGGWGVGEGGEEGEGEREGGRGGEKKIEEKQVRVVFVFLC